MQWSEMPCSLKLGQHILHTDSQKGCIGEDSSSASNRSPLYMQLRLGPHVWADPYHIGKTDFRSYQSCLREKQAKSQPWVQRDVKGQGLRSCLPTG